MSGTKKKAPQIVEPSIPTEGQTMGSPDDEDLLNAPEQGTTEEQVKKSTEEKPELDFGSPDRTEPVSQGEIDDLFGLKGADETFEEDFTDVDQAALLPEGVYDATVTGFEKGTSASGSPMFIWQFEVNDKNGGTRSIRFWTSMSPKARWKVAESLQAVGLAAAGVVFKFKASDVVGKKCRVEVKQDEYNGRKNNKIDKLGPAKDMLSELDAQAKGFAGKF